MRAQQLTALFPTEILINLGPRIIAVMNRNKSDCDHFSEICNLVKDLMYILINKSCPQHCSFQGPLGEWERYLTKIKFYVPLLSFYCLNCLPNLEILLASPKTLYSNGSEQVNFQYQYV